MFIPKTFWFTNRDSEKTSFFLLVLAKWLALFVNIVGPEKDRLRSRNEIRFAGNDDDDN